MANDHVSEEPTAAGQMPAGFSRNGKPPACDAAAVASAAVQQLLPLFQALPNTLAGVLSQVPIRAMTQQHLCAACVTARLGWEARHGSVLVTAQELAAAAAGLGPGDPRAAGLDPAPFLPERFRPGAVPDGLPALSTAITAVGGTEVCAQHIPGAPQAGNRKPFLIAHAGLTGAMVAEAARASATG